MSHPSNKNLCTLILVISVFEIRTYFSLALKKVGSHMWDLLYFQDLFLDLHDVSMKQIWDLYKMVISR